MDIASLIFLSLFLLGFTRHKVVAIASKQSVLQNITLHVKPLNIIFSCVLKTICNERSAFKKRFLHSVCLANTSMHFVFLSLYGYYFNPHT